MLDLLQSLLAFALTMLALATIVTMVMETVARLIRRRSRVFRHMLSLVFEKEIRPLLDDRLPDIDIERAIATIQSSPFVPEKSRWWIVRFAAAVLNHLLGANQSTSLTATEFLERLSRTEVGTRLVERYQGVEAELENSLKRIETRYDEIAAATTEWIKNSTAILSLVIGVGLAIVFNIDGYRLFNAYLSNPSQAAAVSAKADAYLKANEAAERRLQTALENIDKAPEGEDGAAATDALSDFQEEWQRIREKGDELLAEGLPIGFGFYPHCRLPGFEIEAPADPRCMNELVWKDWVWIVVVWLPLVTVTGILIGLGGPFWYDAVVGLMRVTQLLRGTAPAKPEDTRPDDTAAQAPPEQKMATLFNDRYLEADDAAPMSPDAKEDLDLLEMQLDGLARRIGKKAGKSPPDFRKGGILAALDQFRGMPKDVDTLLERYEAAREEWMRIKAEAKETPGS